MLRRLNSRISYLSVKKTKNKDFPFSWKEFTKTREAKIAGKIGGSELLALEYSFRLIRPCFPKSMSWKRPAERVFYESGVFPLEKTQFQKFLIAYTNAVGSMDAVKLWQRDPFLKYFEKRLAEKLCPQAIPLGPGLLNYSSIVDLADLNWLVVSPFTRSMKLQACRMKEIHPDHKNTSNFKDFEKRCQFLPCPLYSHLQPSPFRSWSEGLERLTEMALKTNYDLAIVGAGAWSLPLLANLKKEGRSGIHLGGETQLVFGIKGKRWDSHGIYTEAWVRPDQDEAPKGKERLEQGCYW